MKNKLKFDEYILIGIILIAGVVLLLSPVNALDLNCSGNTCSLNSSLSTQNVPDSTTYTNGTSNYTYSNLYPGVNNHTIYDNTSGGGSSYPIYDNNKSNDYSYQANLKDKNCWYDLNFCNLGMNISNLNANSNVNDLINMFKGSNYQMNSNLNSCESSLTLSQKSVSQKDTTIYVLIALLIICAIWATYVTIINRKEV